MSDLSAMINSFITTAQLTNGCPAKWVLARDGNARQVTRGASIRPPRWTKDEETFYLENVGKLSYEDMAASLGRTVTGMRIHAKRHGFPAATEVPGYLTTHKIAQILGVDCHKPPNWVEAGILAGERYPFAGRTIHRVKLSEFKKWIVRPESWVYFCAGRIKSDYFRRLVELAQARWGDAWWSTRQAAEFQHCDTADIQRQIELGYLSGYQAKMISGRHYDQSWALWFVRRSEAEKLVIHKAGKGNKGIPRLTYLPDKYDLMLRLYRRGKRWGEIRRELQRSSYSPRADAFILRCRAESKVWSEIGRLMKRPWQQVAYRGRCLEKKAGRSTA